MFMRAKIESNKIYIYIERERARVRDAKEGKIKWKVFVKLEG